MDNINIKIRKALQISYQGYDNVRFDWFCVYCKNLLPKTKIPLQKLITSKHLYAWYCIQWNSLVEQQFYIDNKQYLDLNINNQSVYRSLFMAYVSKIDNYYPEILLNKIKTTLKRV